VVRVFDNTTAALSTKCLITPGGCVYTKGFKTAQLKFTLTKNGLPMMVGTKDACQIMESAGPQVKEIFTKYGIPYKCPVPEVQVWQFICSCNAVVMLFFKGPICPDATKKADVSRFKQYLQMARGRNVIHAEVEHDTVKM
jgi:hypothetical protein